MNKLYLALPFFLYFPRLIPGVETQPLIIFCAGILSLLATKRTTTKLHYSILVLVLSMLGLASYVSTGNFLSSALLLQLIVGPTILFGAFAVGACSPERKNLNYVAIFFLLIALIEIISPNGYRAIASFLMERVSVADGHRGVSLLTPEPTYAAMTMVYFLVLSLWTRRQGKKDYPWIEFIFSILLIMTLSTYLALFVMAVCVAKWPRVTLLTASALIVFISSVHWVAMGNDESIRLVVAISRVLTTDFSNFLPSLSAADSSVGSRVLTNYAAFSTARHSIFGLGLGCQSMSMAFELAGLDYAFRNPVIRDVMAEGCLKAQSFGASVFLGLGLAGLLYVWFISKLVTLCAKRYEPNLVLWPVALALALLMLVVQSQMTNPIPWLLIYVALIGNRPGDIRLMTLYRMTQEDVGNKDIKHGNSTFSG